MFTPLKNWLDHRTGYKKLVSHILDEPVVGGASFAYVFGSVLTFILVSQFLTGVLLATVYSPSLTDAWASVAYIQDQVPGGWFVRGLHAHGASLMVIFCVLHLLQTSLFGAYKKPRELNWIIGVVLMLLILGFALTGYLLPWDQKGYWATQVATGIAGSTPVVGDGMQTLLVGGTRYGNLTITRFFALHVFILPAVTLLMLGLHLLTFRRFGQTPPWWKTKEALATSTESFWPKQVAKDLIAIGGTLLALVGFVLLTHGAELGAPADPASQFEARPEWYFRPLFQLLKYVEGHVETMVALGVPALTVGFLMALPFLDKNESRSPRRRWVWLGLLLGGLFGFASLLWISIKSDQDNPRVQKNIKKWDANSEHARRLAKTFGVPADGGVHVYTMEPGFRAKEIWKKDCALCHEGDKRSAPLIAEGYNSRAWLKDFLKSPSGDLFFGRTDIKGMSPSFSTQENEAAIVEWLYAQTGAKDAKNDLAIKGLQLIEDSDCSNCHSTDGTTDDDMGPNLGERGSISMLKAFIKDPEHPLWFGEKNEMPKQGPYSDEDLSALAIWLHGLSKTEWTLNSAK